MFQHTVHLKLHMVRFKHERTAAGGREEEERRKEEGGGGGLKGRREIGENENERDGEK